MKNSSIKQKVFKVNEGSKDSCFRLYFDFDKDIIEIESYDGFPSLDAVMKASAYMLFCYREDGASFRRSRRYTDHKHRLIVDKKDDLDEIYVEFIYKPETLPRGNAQKTPTSDEALVLFPAYEKIIGLKEGCLAENCQVKMSDFLEICLSRGMVDISGNFFFVDEVALGDKMEDFQIFHARSTSEEKGWMEPGEVGEIYFAKSNTFFLV